jgi:hypothetical protein
VGRSAAVTAAEPIAAPATSAVANNADLAVVDPEIVFFIAVAP